MRLPASLDVLHERNFARYPGAIVASHLGGGMANVALAFAVLGFGTATDLTMTGAQPEPASSA